MYTDDDNSNGDDDDDDDHDFSLLFSFGDDVLSHPVFDCTGYRQLCSRM